DDLVTGVQTCALPIYLPSLLRAAERAADAGAAVVAEGFGSAGNAREKAPGDWVSDVDTNSESAVRDVLEHASPSLPVFGEAGGGDRTSTRLNSSHQII